MNRFWLKIAGALVLASAAIIAVLVLWPAKTGPVAESTDTGAAKQRQAVGAEKGPAQAESLYRLALLYEGKGSLPYLRYKKTADCCREILQRYPDSPQAKKARELLSRIPKRYQKQISITDTEISLKQESAAEQDMNLEYANSLKTAKSVGRLRPDLPEIAEFEISKPQAEKMHQKNMSRILEMYPNSRQREKVGELLLKTLRHRPEEYNDTDEKMGPEYLNSLKAGRARQLQLRNKAPFRRYTERGEVIDKKKSTQYLKSSGDKTKGLPLKEPKRRNEKPDVPREAK